MEVRRVAGAVAACGGVGVEGAMGGGLLCTGRSGRKSEILPRGGTKSETNPNELKWRNQKSCAPVARRAMVRQMSEVLLVMMPSTPISRRRLASSGSLMV